MTSIERVMLLTKELWPGLAVQPRGGLGNRMLSLLSSHWWACHIGRRFFVYWPTGGVGNPKNRFEAGLDDLYRVDGIRYLSSHEWTELVQQLRRHYYTTRASQELLQAPDESPMLMADLHGPLQLQVSSDQLADWFRLYYRPVSRLQSRIDDLCSQIHPDSSVGLQVRCHGHSRTTTWRPQERFTALLQKFSCERPLRHVFLSCDDSSVQQSLCCEHPRIIAQPKRHEINSLAALEDTVVDLHVLARCREFYGSYCSGLSVFVSWLRAESRVALPEDA